MSGNQSRRKGDQYERDVVNYLASIGVNVTRAKRGNKTGDILRLVKLVLECKNQTKYRLGAWMKQTKLEQLEAEADYGIMIVKRAGTTDVGKHYFIMEAAEGFALLKEAGRIG